MPIKPTQNKQTQPESQQTRQMPPRREPQREPQREREIWGGLKCTVNRILDSYSCQMSKNGHATRRDDLERFASLGIRTIRYPVLW